MIYLDTNLLIYLVESRGTENAAVRQAIRGSEDDGFAISPLSVMECLVGAYRRPAESLRARYQVLFEPMTMVGMGLAVFEDAARLRATHRLGTPDALHLAAARAGGCNELWTNDDRLGRAAGSFARVVGR